MRDDQPEAVAVVANDFLRVNNPKLIPRIVVLDGRLVNELSKLLDADVRMTIIEEKGAGEIWRIDNNGKIVLKGSGRHVRVVRFNLIRFSEHKATIVASWAVGNLGESIYEYEVERTSGKWRIIERKLSGMA